MLPVWHTACDVKIRCKDTHYSVDLRLWCYRNNMYSRRKMLKWSGKFRPTKSELDLFTFIHILITPLIRPSFSYSCLNEPRLRSYLWHKIIDVFLNNIQKVNNNYKRLVHLCVEGTFNSELSKNLLLCPSQQC